MLYYRPMLPQEYRLKRKRDFEILFKDGQFIAGPLIQLTVWKINPNKYPKRGYSNQDLKIGFVVGLKVSKSAVKRNRVKRQMREVVRLLLKDGKFNRGYLLAFVAKKGVLGKEYKVIEQNILALLTRGRLLA